MKIVQTGQTAIAATFTAAGALVTPFALPVLDLATQLFATRIKDIQFALYANDASASSITATTVNGAELHFAAGNALMLTTDDIVSINVYWQKFFKSRTANAQTFDNVQSGELWKNEIIYRETNFYLRSKIDSDSIISSNHPIYMRAVIDYERVLLTEKEAIELFL